MNDRTIGARPVLEAVIRLDAGAGLFAYKVWSSAWSGPVAIAVGRGSFAEGLRDALNIAVELGYEVATVRTGAVRGEGFRVVLPCRGMTLEEAAEQVEAYYMTKG